MKHQQITTFLFTLPSKKSFVRIHIPIQNYTLWLCIYTTSYYDITCASVNTFSMCVSNCEKWKKLFYHKKMKSIIQIITSMTNNQKSYGYNKQSVSMITALNQILPFNICYNKQIMEFFTWYATSLWYLYA